MLFINGIVGITMVRSSCREAGRFSTGLGLEGVARRDKGGLLVLLAGLLGNFDAVLPRGLCGIFDAVPLPGLTLLMLD